MHVLCLSTRQADCQQIEPHVLVFRLLLNKHFSEKVVQDSVCAHAQVFIDVLRLFYFQFRIRHLVGLENVVRCYSWPKGHPQSL